MKNILTTVFFLFCAMGLWAQPCTNGDFELGTLSPQWKGYISTAPSTGTLNLSAFSPPTIVPGRHTLINSSYVDPVLGSTIMPGVGAGSFSARLGNNSTGAESEIMSYTFTLTPNFSFMYALVFQNPHMDSIFKNPFFTYWISLTENLPTSAAGPNLLAMQEYRADTSGFYQDTVIGSNLVYKQWTKECVMTKFPSLSSHVGKKVTIYFATADCSATGHYGYAYIDELCKPNMVTSSFTAPTSIGNGATYPLNVDGTASTYESQYYYRAQECNAAGVVTSGGLDASTLIVTGTAGAANIRGWFPPGPGFFVHGKYYRITLNVHNCNSTATSFRIVYVN